MQGAFPSTKIASPSSSESDFSVVEKKCEEGEKIRLKCWKIAF
nr:MAG TPA: Interferon-inducible protein [Caudoviricetes sp.]